MIGKGLFWGLAAVLLAALVWAWIDGGHEPVRDMAISVTVPEFAR